MYLRVHQLSAESMGLAVVEKRSDRIVVRELAKGNGSYDFDYMIMAVRKGFEDYQVIRSTVPKGCQSVHEPEQGL